MSGFISINRQITSWEWYTDNNVKSLFIHCLLKANFKDNSWRGIDIKRGSFITSNNKLSLELNLSIQKIRTALNKLESTNEITINTTNKNTLITVIKYDNYQNNQQTDNKQTTNQQQTNNKPITTTNKDNNNNKENKVIKTILDREAEFKNSLQPFLSKYGKDLLNDFYLYWTEKKPRGRKMAFEMKKTFDIERRLITWNKNDFNNKNNGNSKSEKPTLEELHEKHQGYFSNQGN